MEEKKVTITDGTRMISVIVPVYKVEPYLRICIDSILAQTLTDFELILVDDGSPDNCGAICDEYAAVDDRVVVIHQKNQGVSAARNAGIDWVFANSTSKWITFVDSDDAISPLFLERLYQHAVETNASMVATDGYHFHADEELTGGEWDCSLIETKEGKLYCIPYFMGECKVSPYPWGKLCKKEILEGLRFPIGIAYKEDEMIVGQLLYVAAVVSVVSGGLYYYRMRADSVAHERFSMNRFGHIKGLDSCIAFFAEKNELEIVKYIKKRRKNYLAKYNLLAHGAKITEYVPDEYKMNVWKAFFITLTETIRRGGIKYIGVRVRQFVVRIKRD